MVDGLHKELAELKERLPSDSSLADELRQLLVVGDDPRAQSLRDWALRELKGYKTGDVPDYRLIPVPELVILADVGNVAVSDNGVAQPAVPKIERISLAALPESIQRLWESGFPIQNGVAELESMAMRSKRDGTGSYIAIDKMGMLAVYLESRKVLTSDSDQRVDGPVGRARQPAMRGGVGTGVDEGDSVGELGGTVKGGQDDLEVVRGAVELVTPPVGPPAVPNLARIYENLRIPISEGVLHQLLDDIETEARRIVTSIQRDLPAREIEAQPPGDFKSVANKDPGQAALFWAKWQVYVGVAALVLAVFGVYLTWLQVR